MESRETGGVLPAEDLQIIKLKIVQIGGLQKTTLIDFPGHIACVVFTVGCNVRCPFCHNRQLVTWQNLKRSRLSLIPESDFFAFLKKRRGILEGVVVSGGEPTLQSDLSGFLSRCKRMGFKTMLETNGSRPKTMVKLLNGQMVDYIAMDIKAPLDKNYAKIVSKKDFDFTLLLNSIKVILNSGVKFEFRTTVVPTIHDKKNMVELARQLYEEVQGYRGTEAQSQSLKWILQNFQPKNCLDPKFNKLKPYSQNEMEEILAAVREYIPGAKLRG